jgi:hypothetical protein
MSPTEPTAEAEPVVVPRTLSARLNRVWLRLPVAVRKFVLDATEGALGAIIVLNLADVVFLPHSIDEATAQAMILASAVATPIVSAGRRNLLPAFLGWLLRTFPRPA